MRATLVFAAILSSTPVAQERATPLHIAFTASAESFEAATQEYRDIWAGEGSWIVASMERATGLRFEPGPIRAVIYEGPTFPGFGERPMPIITALQLICSNSLNRRVDTGGSHVESNPV